MTTIERLPTRDLIASAAKANGWRILPSYWHLDWETVCYCRGVDGERLYITWSSCGRGAAGITYTASYNDRANPLGLVRVYEILKGVAS